MQPHSVRHASPPTLLKVGGRRLPAQRKMKNYTVSPSIGLRINLAGFNVIRGLASNEGDESDLLMTDDEKNNEPAKKRTRSSAQKKKGEKK